METRPFQHVAVPGGLELRHVAPHTSGERLAPLSILQGHVYLCVHTHVHMRVHTCPHAYTHNRSTSSKRLAMEEVPSQSPRSPWMSQEVDPPARHPGAKPLSGERPWGNTDNEGGFLMSGTDYR